MSPGALTELPFEARVEAELLVRGWTRAQGTFDGELSIDTGAIYQFISATQQANWDRLVGFYGGDAPTARRQFAQRVASEIDARGTLDVLRQGVKDRGVQIDLAYFRPGHTLAVDALAEYDANILTVARQLHFSSRYPSKSVDMALFLNGLPVATVELKNPNTGQNADHAVAQYRRDRDPNEVFFAKRTLVHFAVDPDRAFITTRLRGADTQFLPFNIGSNGPGVSGGAGNPDAAPGSYSVAYLWEQIWQRDNWLEILHRFLHVKVPDRKGVKENPHTSPKIFPRYHQWHAVQRMIDHARTNGAGSNYLIQHSAGSGKSNTIAWLSHRLSNLFDAGNQPVFHKTIVITDRVVLDRQLQRTVFQFDHTPGVVKKIDEDSAQLAVALDDATSKIIISTLQLYPFVLGKIADMGLSGRRYAVIIDEAHSSQGGETAIKLKQAIGANAVREEDEDDAEYMTRVRGPQPNLSYFAFTATPKSPTLKLFGIFDPDRIHPRTGEKGMHVPFHIYSMRQAIDEGYILDVLANYITYDTKWRLRNAAVEQAESRAANPEVDASKTKKKLVRYAEQHPKSLEQKAKLIVEDFRENLVGRLGGRAKAMVVTNGREHALHLYQAIRTYVSRCGYTDCGTLVAFSGQLKDDAENEYTEAKLNGFPESQLPDRFGYTKADDPQAAARDQDEYRLLVVAEKYQTGFDQPLLCGMYVDKPLTGVSAVQTLSRLNRTHPLKSQDDVHILDFVNEAADIQAAFEDWFETTITEPSDPNLLYAKQHAVMDYGLLAASEMEAFIRVLGSAGTERLTETAERKLHAELHEYLKPALDRFAALETEDEREGFRDALKSYVRAYSLIAQIVDWGDRDLERLYQYGRILLIRLPGRPSTSVDIGDADLSHFRLEFTGRHNASLSPVGDRDVRGHAADGGGFKEPELEPLSAVIQDLNDRFGLGLGTSDQILVFQQVAALVEDTGAQQVALMNDEARFGQVVDGRLDDIVADHAERNTDFMKLYFDNNEFRKAIKDAARSRAYRIITEPAREEALARLRAEMYRETGDHSVKD
jgi:type I restriction enzyme R subunit